MARSPVSTKVAPNGRRPLHRRAFPLLKARRRHARPGPRTWRLLQRMRVRCTRQRRQTLRRLMSRSRLARRQSVHLGPRLGLTCLCLELSRPKTRSPPKRRPPRHLASPLSHPASPPSHPTSPPSHPTSLPSYLTRPTTHRTSPPRHPHRAYPLPPRRPRACRQHTNLTRTT